MDIVHQLPIWEEFSLSCKQEIKDSQLLMSPRETLLLNWKLKKLLENLKKLILKLKEKRLELIFNSPNKSMHMFWPSLGTSKKSSKILNKSTDLFQQAHSGTSLFSTQALLLNSIDSSENFIKTQVLLTTRDWMLILSLS